MDEMTTNNINQFLSSFTTPMLSLLEASVLVLASKWRSYCFGVKVEGGDMKIEDRRGGVMSMSFISLLSSLRIIYLYSILSTDTSSRRYTLSPPPLRPTTLQLHTPHAMVDTDIDTFVCSAHAELTTYAALS